MTYHETGYMDDRGKIYIKPAKGGWFWTVLVALSCLILGVFLAPRLPEQFWAWVYPVEGQAGPALLPTAAVVFSQPGAHQSAQPPRQDRPPPQGNPAPPQEAPAAAFDPLPTVERPEPPPAEQPAPAVVPPTPLPEPGEDGFAESFAEPTCSAFNGYLRNHPCYGRAGQPPLPEPGEEGFAESFVEPGD
jgi:hypothetical protein